MAIVVHSRQAIVGVLVLAAVAGCGSGATPTPSPSATPKPTATAASPSASAASPAASPSGSGTVYVVKKGDTLTAIARRFHITLDALRKANPQIKDPNKLSIGQKLTIPAPQG